MLHVGNENFRNMLEIQMFDFPAYHDFIEEPGIYGAITAFVPCKE